MKFALAILIAIQGAVAVDPNFSVDPKDIRQDEIAHNVKETSRAVMGIAEYIVDIKHEVHRLHRDLHSVQLSVDRVKNVGEFRGAVQDVSEVDKINKNEQLAQKVEKLLAAPNSPKVEAAKEEMRKSIENNFVRMLAAILVTGPVRTQQRSEDIFKLMRTVLNGELDFMPVVEKLPFLLREKETNQFIAMLRTLRETEKLPHNANYRQFGGLENVGGIVDALGSFDIKQVSGFLKEIPELFEGVETVVDGVDEYF